MFTTVALCVALVLQDAAPVIDLPRVLKPLEFEFTGGGYKKEKFKYRLYVPRQADISNPLPMVVWMHGLSQAGSNNIAQMKGIDKFLLNGEDTAGHPYFILAVQCPANNNHWSPCRDPKTQDDMVNVLSAIIKKTWHDYPIDGERISVTGLSSGGYGAWELGIRFPELLSAIAPHGAGQANLAKIKNLKDVPVWAFHSENDKAVGPDGARRNVQMLNRAGGRALLTEIPASASKVAYYEGHDCWTSAFQDYYLLDWLLSQRKGKSSYWNGPGSISLSHRVSHAFRGWTWGQLLLQAAVPVAIVAGVWSVIRARRIAAEA